MASKLRGDIIDAEDPYVEAIFDYVYAEPHPILEAEKNAYINYLESFAEGDKCNKVSFTITADCNLPCFM